jgi:beta-mannanase
LRSSSRIVALCLAALLVAGMFASASAATRRVALGVSMLKDRDIATYDAFSLESGRAPALWTIWSDWGTPKTQFLPMDFMLHIKSKGSVPIINWQPVNSAAKWDRSFSYKKISSGRHDPYIKAFAQQVNEYGGRVLIRFAHEFDGSWYPWGVGSGENSFTWFKKAWGRIWKIFRDPSAGLAKQARFVWSPQGSKSRDWMAKAFPNKSYVDYLGFTAFNWVTYKRTQWYSLARIVTHRMSLFKDLPPKRVIVTETGTDYRRGSKAAWLKDGYAAVYTRWPRIVAINYFNVDMRLATDPNRLENWALEYPSDGSAMAAYRALLNQARFKGRVY